MKDVTKATWDAELREFDGIGVVKIGATWCAPCRFMKKIFQKFEGEFGTDKVQFFELDRDDDPDFAERILRITSLPSIAFVVQGKIFTKTEGIINQAKFKEALTKAEAFYDEVSKG